MKQGGMSATALVGKHDGKHEGSTKHRNEKYQNINNQLAQTSTIDSHQNEGLIVGVVGIQGAKIPLNRLLEVGRGFLAVVAIHGRVVSVLLAVDVAEH